MDDPTFLRRSFLVAAGRIPTLEEASSFLEIEDPSKREMLTQYLLQSDGYRSHMQNYVFDLLRAKDNDRDGGGGLCCAVYEFCSAVGCKKYSLGSVRAQFGVSKGNSLGRWQRCRGYYIRDKGMPLDNLALTMQIFTGERFECAQCHDSPTNKWERMDFYELAAFTHGQREINDGVWNRAMRSYNDEDFRRSDIGRLFYWLRDNIHYGTIADQGAGRIKLPSDYQYKDGDPGEMIGGGPISVRKSVHPTVGIAESPALNF